MRKIYEVSRLDFATSLSCTGKMQPSRDIVL